MFGNKPKPRGKSQRLATVHGLEVLGKCLQVYCELLFSKKKARDHGMEGRVIARETEWRKRKRRKRRGRRRAE